MHRHLLSRSTCHLEVGSLPRPHAFITAMLAQLKAHQPILVLFDYGVFPSSSERCICQVKYTQPPSMVGPETTRTISTIAILTSSFPPFIADTSLYYDTASLITSKILYTLPSKNIRQVPLSHTDRDQIATSPNYSTLFTVTLHTGKIYTLESGLPTLRFHNTLN